MSPLDVALLELAREHVATEIAGDGVDVACVFVCPDCDDDPDCPTCGEPSRRHVLSWLQLIFRGWPR